MKRVLGLFAAVALAAGLGCGKDDPNKDLKPIDPNTPPPQPAAGDGAGKKQQGDTPPPVIK